MSYYNSTNLKGQELKDRKEKAVKQDVQILNLFIKHGVLSTSKIQQLLPKILKTSIRRSLNTLEYKKLKIEKILDDDNKRVLVMGSEGAKESLYQLL